MKLVVENLVLNRGARTIVGGLSFTLAGGNALVLTGPNGVGKTTLVRAVAGFLPPMSGRIALEGGDTDRPVAEECHYVGHLNGLKSSLTAAENLAFWARYLGRSGESDGADIRSAIDRALATFGLEALAAIPAGYLSAGQKRRLGLARLLVAHRPLWLLDEPTVSLDARSAQMLAGEIDRHTAAGGLVLAATHLDLGLSRASELRLGSGREAA